MRTLSRTFFCLVALLVLNACAGDYSKNGTQFATYRDVEPPEVEPTQTLESLTEPLRASITGRVARMTREEVVQHIGMDPHHVEQHAQQRVLNGVLEVQDVTILGWYIDKDWKAGPDLAFFGGSLGRVDGHKLFCIIDNLQDNGVLIEVAAVDVADVPVAELWGDFSRGVGVTSSVMVGIAAWQVAKSARGVEENTKDIADSADNIDQSVSNIDQTIDDRTTLLEDITNEVARSPNFRAQIDQLLRNRLGVQ